MSYSAWNTDAICLADQRNYCKWFEWNNSLLQWCLRERERERENGTNNGRNKWIAEQWIDFLSPTIGGGKALNSVSATTWMLNECDHHHYLLEQNQCTELTFDYWRIIANKGTMCNTHSHARCGPAGCSSAVATRSVRHIESERVQLGIIKINWQLKCSVRLWRDTPLGCSLSLSRSNRSWVEILSAWWT